MKERTDIQRLEALRDYYAREGGLPSYQGIATVLGYASTSAASAFVVRLAESGHLRKGVNGRVVPGDRFFERLLSDSKVPAGSPIDLDDPVAGSIDIGLLCRSMR